MTVPPLVLFLCLPNHIRQTAVKPTARETWDDLETTYGTPGATGLFGIFREAIDFESAENSDPAMPIASLTSIFDCLDAPGLTLTEPAKAMILLAALPCVWDGLAMTMLSQHTGKNLTLTAIIPKIQHEYNCRRSNATLLASRLSTVNKKHKSKNAWSKQKKQKQNADASGTNQQASSSSGNNSNYNKGNQKKKGKGKGKAHANEASTDNLLPVANFASFSSSADPLKDIDPYTGKLDPLLRDMKIEEQELPPDWARFVVDNGFARIDDYDKEMYGSSNECTSYWQVPFNFLKKKISNSLHWLNRSSTINNNTLHEHLYHATSSYLFDSVLSPKPLDEAKDIKFMHAITESKELPENNVRIQATTYNTSWLLDSGASHHFTPNIQDFADYKEWRNPIPLVSTDKKSRSHVLGTGTVYICHENGTGCETRCTKWISNQCIPNVSHLDVGGDQVQPPGVTVP